MIDTRKTLINLHNKFPNLTLDDLFEILDCCVETPSIWPYTYDKQNTWPLTKINYGNPTCTTTKDFEVPQKCD